MAMTPLTPVEDLWPTCVHEAAHVVVATHYGACAGAVVFPIPTTDPVSDRTWGGRCTLFTPLADPRDRIVAGMAGMAAEMILTDPEADECDVFNHLLDAFEWGDGLSDSDRAMVDGYSLEDIGACIALVSQLWPEIVEGAEHLRRRARPKG